MKIIRFSGKLSQIHITKNKPVKEGYKWFMLTESIAYYIANFTPDVRMVSKHKKLTDEINEKGGGNIIVMIKLHVQSLVDSIK